MDLSEIKAMLEQQGAAWADFRQKQFEPLRKAVAEMEMRQQRMNLGMGEPSHATGNSPELAVAIRSFIAGDDRAQVWRASPYDGDECAGEDRRTAGPRFRPQRITERTHRRLTHRFVASEPWRFQHGGSINLSMVRRLILRWQIHRSLADRKRRRMAGFARPYLKVRGR